MSNKLIWNFETRSLVFGCPAQAHKLVYLYRRRLLMSVRNNIVLISLLLTEIFSGVLAFLIKLNGI